MWKKVVSKIEDYNMKKKLTILYVYCVLIPLILTDSVILYIVIQAENKAMERDMENIASAVLYNLTYDVETAASSTKNIYMNKYVNQFLDINYKSALEYYLSYRNFMKDSLFESSIAIADSKIIMYADNNTIVNGGEFARLEGVRAEEWYKRLQESNQDFILYIYYDESKAPTVEAKRKISFIRKLNFYKREGIEKLVKLDMDYSSMG